MKGRVLVVDDEKNVGFVIEAMLEKAGYETLCFQDSRLAMEAIEGEELDAVITDLYMPGAGGMEVLEFCQRVQPQVPVVMITAFGTIESAVQALKHGAFDFITKPFEQEDLLAIMEKAVGTHRERMKEPIPLFTAAGPQLVRESTPQEDDTLLVGESDAIQNLRRLIVKVAPTDSTALLVGESGTGKEVVANEIHRLSKRAEKPLIKVNCAVIPAALIESELFGHERGAFTGAVAAKPGRFELAHEGTLFLDEVGEMPPEMQAKLLRVLQDQTFERVGGVNPIQVNVRIIAATNRDLEEEVRAGRFREDLFYRLNVFPVRLPALRERQSDIEGLVRAALTQCNRKFNKRISSIEPGCLEALTRYAWPGNVRQLENVMERMVLLAEDETLRVSDLPEEFEPTLAALREESGESPGGALSFKERVRRETQNVERDLIVKALDEEQGNVTRTAEKLGLSRKGLQLKMKELGIRRV